MTSSKRPAFEFQARLLAYPVQARARAVLSARRCARLAALGPGRRGRAFGSYGGWRSRGSALGPLLGGALMGAGGFPALFPVPRVPAAGGDVWAALVVPNVPPVPKE